MNGRFDRLRFLWWAGAALLLVIAAVALLYWALKNGHIKLDNGQVGQLARTMGGYALVGLAITLLTTGKILMAIPAGVAGLWLMA